VSIADPRKKNKMLKTDPKKIPSQKYYFACSSRYGGLTFYEKKIPTSKSLNGDPKGMKSRETSSHFRQVSQLQRRFGINAYFCHIR